MYKRRPNIPSTSFHLQNIKRQSSTHKQQHSLQILTRTHQLNTYNNLPHGKLACYIDTLRSITRPNSPVTSFHVKNVKRLSSTNQLTSPSKGRALHINNHTHYKSLQEIMKYTHIPTFPMESSRVI